MRELAQIPLDGSAFAARYGPWAVIAGASEGTGACFAEELAEMGINLVLVARRADALDALGARLKASHGVEFRAIVQDLSAPGAGEMIVAACAKLDVGLYISNAGADNFTHFFEDPVESAHRLVRMNIATLIDAAHGFGRRFLDRGRGGIVVMASGAGLGGQPLLALYSATKAFEINFAESLWAEYSVRGIDAIAVAAPIMNTPMLQRTVAGMGFDFTQTYDPAAVTHNALAGLLAGEPLQIVPDGPLQERLPRQLEERKERLAAFIEFQKNFTGEA
jgi:uncharacterized protein